MKYDIDEFNCTTVSCSSRYNFTILFRRTDYTHLVEDILVSVVAEMLVEVQAAHRMVQVPGREGYPEVVHNHQWDCNPETKKGVTDSWVRIRLEGSLEEEHSRQVDVGMKAGDREAGRSQKTRLALQQEGSRTGLIHPMEGARVAILHYCTCDLRERHVFADHSASPSSVQHYLRNDPRTAPPEQQSE